MKSKSVGKNLRILDMFERLNRGEALDKKELALEYSISEKSVQRDFEELRAYLAEKYADESDVSIDYDSTKKAYFLVRREREYLTCMEIMSISKILLESRAFIKDELYAVLDKLILQASLSDRLIIREMILNERFYYVAPQHNTPLIETIWDLSGFIKRQEVISFSYTRQDGKKLQRFVEPVALAFSEYYFYLIGYIEGLVKEFPAIFRLDRCEGIKSEKRHFSFTYKDKFNLGLFKKRIQFMYPGPLLKVKFSFWGSSLEAVLDRLPGSRVVAREGEKHIVEAEVYGVGIKMWLLSQREFLEVLEPEELREDMQRTLEEMRGVYGDRVVIQS